MTTKYDPETVDRLRRFKVVPRAKCTADGCDNGFMHHSGPISGDWDEPCDACFSTGLAAVQNLADMCDQLEAASLEILALKNANASPIPEAIEHLLTAARNPLGRGVWTTTPELLHALADQVECLLVERNAALGARNMLQDLVLELLAAEEVWDVVRWSDTGDAEKYKASARRSDAHRALIEYRNTSKMP